MTAFLFWVRTVPSWVWTALAILALAGGLYLKGRSDGKEACQSAQEAAERKADAKAATVAKKAQERAQKAVERIHDRTEDVADEIDRQMDGVCPDVEIPESVRKELEGATERARRAGKDA